MTLAVGAFFAMAAPPDGSSGLQMLSMFAIIAGIFWFIVILPARRREQKVQEFRSGLKVGDKIITTGGIYGQVTRVSGDVVQVQIADKVRIDIAKAAVGGYQGQPPVVEPPTTGA